VDDEINNILKEKQAQKEVDYIKNIRFMEYAL
jgi:hypothetical protein